MLGARITSRCSGRSRLTCGEIVVGDLAQAAAELGGDADAVELGVFVHDGEDGVDVVREQLGRHLLEIRRVLDDAAQALGNARRGRKTERRGVALDVMRGAEQLVAPLLGEAVVADGDIGGRQPVDLGRHPVLELAGEARKRLLGAGDRIVHVLFVDPAQNLAQRIGLRDHLMRGEGLDLDVSCAVLRHDACLVG